MDSCGMSLLSNDPKRYSQAFEEYSKRGCSTEIFHECVRNVTPAPLDGSLFRVLSVGAGTGDKDCLIIDSLLQRYSNVHETVIELNADSIGKFQERVRFEMQGKNVQFDWRNESVQDFLNAGEDKQQKFHFIHCIQSLYYNSKPIDIIKQLYDLLVDGGALMVIHQSENGHVWKVDMEVQSIYPNDGDNGISGEDIYEYFNSHDFSCMLDFIDCNIDISNCYDEESEPGNQLIDFFTHVKNFRRTAPPELRERVLAIFTSAGIGVDGRPYFSDSLAKIVIWKKGK